MPHIALAPKGFKTFVTNLGIKDETEDFVCIYSVAKCRAVGVFTQSSFVGSSVVVSKENIKNRQAQALVIISKNSNVATGAQGMRNTQEIVTMVATRLSVPPSDILIASTGVIGRHYPMDIIRRGINTLLPAGLAEPANFAAAARGMMTTDTVPKYFSVKVGAATLVGIAKGVGMIEPDMATLLTFFLTDAAIESAVLDDIFRRVMNKTFNCLSIDTDTSTSDTAIIMANGLAGDVDIQQFESALMEVATKLVKYIAKDGEGATKLIEVTVHSARNDSQAKSVAKSIVNSPLVKTAVHGADPNWGRVAMAIGKCSDSADIDQDKTVIKFNNMIVYPDLPDADALMELEKTLHNDEIKIAVELNIKDGYARVWGCDLSAGYVKINAEYTT